jgi:predicted ATPase
MKKRYKIIIGIGVFTMNDLNFRENIFLCAANWCVITGAPCSGKTTVITELERRGYKVIHEVARDYIESELKKGKSLHLIKSEELLFERHILNKKIEIEASLSKEDLMFFDRGIPDSIAYYKGAGLDIKEPVKQSRRVRYKKVFLLERVAFTDDPVRVENDEKAEKLQSLIIESYEMLGYETFYIPVSPATDRTELILSHLSS